MSKYNFEQKRNDYMTPPEFIQKIFNDFSIEERKFDLDVCCSQKNIPADNYFIEGVKNGLTENWENLNWMNPPFDVCGKWIKKAAIEQRKGHTTYCLIPARTETKFWHDYILSKDGTKCRFGVEVQYLRKGLCFLDPVTSKPVQQKVKQKDGSYKVVNGVFKNSLALVVFHGLENGTQQLTFAA